MPTYLIPVYKYENGKNTTHFIKVEGNNRYEAMDNAINLPGCSSIPGKDVWFVSSIYKDYQEYKDCNCKDYNGKKNESFTSFSQNDIIESSKHGEADDYMNVYDYMIWGDYDAQIQALADKALPERWSFEGKDDNSILKNYLRYTFNRLQSEDKVLETDNYCVFNTGLFTPYYAPIYVYGEPNKNTSENATKWYFKGFKDEYELGQLNLETKAPERADYFQDPGRLLFNWHNKVIVNNKHILDDLNTSERLPESLKNSSRPLQDLNGVINIAIQRVIANYKIAIPHYYQSKIQLLIPLYFDNNETPDVALVLDLLKNGDYLATTCLTMDMAYMDARLIAKPELNWLSLE